MAEVIFLTRDELLNRLADVCAQLHEEQGNREELLSERVHLVERIRQLSGTLAEYTE